MRFTSLFLIAASAITAFAQSKPNPFIIPNGGLNFTAGESKEIQWTPTTDGTVTLVLRSGASNDLNAGQAIATQIPNSGSYTWNVDPSITRGTDYTIEIISDSDTNQTNYTPYFTIESNNTVPSSTAPFTYGATATSISSASKSSAAASTTGKPSSSGSSKSASASASGSASGSASMSLSMSASGTSSAITVATGDNGGIHLKAAGGLMAAAAFVAVVL